MNKEWHENIPENGVLCKTKSGGIRLTTRNEGDFCFLDGGNINYMYAEDLSPLTADEFWKFAPWQDMDSAPRDETHFLINHNGVLCDCWFKFGLFRALNPIDANEFVVIDFKWLPLPTGHN